MNEKLYGNFRDFHARNEEHSEKYEEVKVEITNHRPLLDELAQRVLYGVIDLIPNVEQNEASSEQTKKTIHEVLDRLIQSENQNLSYADRRRVIKIVENEIFSYGPISILLEDESVTEIMVNGPKNVYAERDGRITRTDIEFRDDKHVMHIITKILSAIGRRVDESSPMVDARLADGSRVNIIIPPLALNGPTITIRKFSVDPLTVNDLISFGTMTREIAQFLELAVRGRMNILVSGGTGSGKTTLLNVISNFIPASERIVTIEDAAEVQLQKPHVISLESRPSNLEGKGEIAIRDLVINSLRMRPDRIVVGEVRGGEALDMLQAMNTGHDGSLTTIHANSPRDTMSRLETLVLMAGMELPAIAIREQISSAINIVVQTARLVDGQRKITKVSEVTGMESDVITLQDIFEFKQTGIDGQGNVIGFHQASGVVPAFLNQMEAQGTEIPSHLFQKNRSL